MTFTMTDFGSLLNQIEAAEQAAHKQGLIATAHMLNRAKNKAGWEVAATLGKRTGGKAKTRRASSAVTADKGGK